MGTVTFKAARIKKPSAGFRPEEILEEGAGGEGGKRQGREKANKGELRRKTSPFDRIISSTRGHVAERGVGGLKGLSRPG